MRFYLDNDVDARCRLVIEARGHECWTASQAGRATASDDDQTVYAQQKGAVIVTHDSEFTERRKKNCIWKHVRLDCEQPDGPGLLAVALDEMVQLLERHENITIEAKPDGIRVWYDWA